MQISYFFVLQTSDTRMTHYVLSRSQQTHRVTCITLRYF